MKNPGNFPKKTRTFPENSLKNLKIFTALPAAMGGFGFARQGGLV